MIGEEEIAGHDTVDQVVRLTKEPLIIGITTNNFGSTQLDSPKDVRHNNELLRMLNADYWVKMRAKHSDRIVFVTKDINDYHDCDALVFCLRNSHQKPLGLANTADCSIVIIYDRFRTCFALVHSGWKGSLLNIVGKTVTAIESELKIKAMALNAYIWPGICKYDYQVGKEFVNHFHKHVYFADSILKLDQKAVITDQLIQAGLDSARIKSSSLCSFHTIYKELSLFHSYRRDNQYYTGPLRESHNKRRNCVFVTPDVI
jgi:hypothetical protein